MKFRLLLSLFLLFTMVTSVAVAVMLQMRSTTICELKECKNEDDNATDSDEEEGKSETEKDFFVYHNTLHLTSEVRSSYFQKNKINVQDETSPSSLYTFLPENPPEL